jgi:hypothetical protein
VKLRLAFSAYLRLAAASISFTLIGAMSVAAQSSSASGRLDGYVTDPSGRAVGGAVVNARNTATGEASSQQTDDRGYFLFLYLSPAHYDVSVKKTGFAPLTLSNVAGQCGNDLHFAPTTRRRNGGNRGFC